VAGSPKVCGSLGSYGEWARVVRSPLVWLGRADPVQSMDAAREEDPVRRAVNSLIDLWRANLTHDVGYTAADLVARANERLPPELHELLLQQAGTPRGDIDPRRVGIWLMSIRGRVHDGYCVDRVKASDAKGNRYALKRTS
jgi:putative DNA primase/helicase